jgi:UDP-3-O-[3-hydroxymyristoyl] N-acetylglucosamine deacetylase/3-hydroxyacyl-[acyl-carrier-protein] dehydratase
VTGTARGTSLTGEKGAELHTVEHFLAAVSGLGLTNLRVDVTGEEMPILDGSSRDFVAGFRSAGVVDQDKEAIPFRPKETIVLEENGTKMRVEPSDRLVLDVVSSFDSPGLERQTMRFEWADGAFEKELEGARTFCMESDLETLRQQGLIKGATLQCGLVYGKTGAMNGPLRYENEVARHKTLDLLGDLALLNRPLEAHVTVERGGHKYHVMLAKALQEQMQSKPLGGLMLDTLEVQKILPHRPPFLLVDRILEVEPQKRAVGIKNVTINEDFFRGHFPGQPLMPGVLILEAMAQVGGVAFLHGAQPGSIVLFAAADNVRWRRPVVPGDTLRMEVELTQVRSRLIKAHGVAMVEGQVVAEADITCMRAEMPAPAAKQGA